MSRPHPVLMSVLCLHFVCKWMMAEWIVRQIRTWVRACVCHSHFVVVVILSFASLPLFFPFFCFQILRIFVFLTQSTIFVYCCCRIVIVRTYFYVSTMSFRLHVVLDWGWGGGLVRGGWSCVSLAFCHCIVCFPGTRWVWARLSCHLFIFIDSHIRYKNRTEPIYLQKVDKQSNSVRNIRKDC